MIGFLRFLLVALNMVLAFGALESAAAEPARQPHVIFNGRACFDKGKTFLNDFKYGKALACFNLCLQHDPKVAALYLHRARCYVNLGKVREAIADFSTALTLNPKLERAHYERAECYEGQGKYRLALKDYDVCLKLFPDDDNYFRHANASLKCGLIDQALADYTRLVKTNPVDVDPLRFRAETYMVKMEYQKALADYTKAISLEQDDPSQIYVARAKCYDKLGKGDLAEQDRKMAKR